MYYVLLPDAKARKARLKRLAQHGVNSVFHYVPLHSSPGGRRFGRPATPDLPVTDELSARLIRLPLWVGLRADQGDRVIEALAEVAPKKPVRGAKVRGAGSTKKRKAKPRSGRPTAGPRLSRL
jgi:dTDP-4-amino-4,6-dideoxygalactose transaminase